MTLLYFSDKIIFIFSPLLHVEIYIFIFYTHVLLYFFKRRGIEFKLTQWSFISAWKILLIYYWVPRSTVCQPVLALKLRDWIGPKPSILTRLVGEGQSDCRESWNISNRRGMLGIANRYLTHKNLPIMSCPTYLAWPGVIAVGDFLAGT